MFDTPILFRLKLESHLGVQLSKNPFSVSQKTPSRENFTKDKV